MVSVSIGGNSNDTNLVVLSEGASINLKNESKLEESLNEEKKYSKLEYKGTVKIFGALIGADERIFNYQLKKISNLLNIDVVYEGSNNFESAVLESRNANASNEIPKNYDILLFPQPGAIPTMSYNYPLKDYLDEDLTFKFGEYIVNLGKKEDGLNYGIPFVQNLKGLIWYRKSQFEKFGYSVPTSWEEMMSLADKMVENGQVPWSICAYSNGATGWLVTDWIENLIIRILGGEDYDKFVSGELLMNSEKLRSVLNVFGKFLKDGYYNKLSASKAYFGVALDSLYPGVLDDVPDGCMMTMQASFIPAFYGSSSKIEPNLEDIDFFVMPDYPGRSGGIVGGGDMATVVSKNPLIKEVLPYLVDQGTLYNNKFFEDNTDNARIPALIGCNLTKAPENIQKQYRALVSANVSDNFRFDGSDLMPPQIGSGLFWQSATQLLIDGESGIEAFIEKYDKDWNEYLNAKPVVVKNKFIKSETGLKWIDQLIGQAAGFKDAPVSAVEGGEVTFVQLKTFVEILGGFGFSTSADLTTKEGALQVLNELIATFGKENVVVEKVYVSETGLKWVNQLIGQAAGFKDPPVSAIEGGPVSFVQLQTFVQILSGFGFSTSADLTSKEGALQVLNELIATYGLENVVVEEVPKN